MIPKNSTVLVAVMDSSNAFRFRKRLVDFYNKNKLNEFPLIFEESKDSFTIIASTPNLRVHNKVSRIVKLISLFQKKKLRLYTFVSSGQLDEVKSVIKRLREC